MAMLPEGEDTLHLAIFTAECAKLMSLFVERGEQAIELLFDHVVALANPRFQSRSIQHGDVTTVVINQSRSLQFPCRLRDAFAAHAQHIGDQFLGHVQLVPG